MNRPPTSPGSRLQQEHSRLYLIPGHTGDQLVSETGLVRALVMELRGPSDWRLLSAAWYGMQTDFELPAPGIAVSGTDSIQLWLSLAEPADHETAEKLVSGLTQRYLQTIQPSRLRTFPYFGTSEESTMHHAMLVPAIQEQTGTWSAFVSADLAAVFEGEPWLDLPPNMDQQAEILSKLRSIRPDQLVGVLAALEAEEPNEADEPKQNPPVRFQSSFVAEHPAPEAKAMLETPSEFLLKVMRDPANALSNRIEAAKALLPYTTERHSGFD